MNINVSQEKKLEELKALGIESYPSATQVPENLFNYDDAAYRLSLYHEQPIQSLEMEPAITLAARLRFKNDMGNIGFGRVEFQENIVQFSVQKNQVSAEDFKIWKKLDLGDWVLISGTWTRTRTGELTLSARSIKLHSKCLQGMPDKVSGISDPETRQRMRYLDLMVNLDSRKRFRQRSSIIAQVRQFLSSFDFMEVETPVLQSIPGGAEARPFTTHHNALDADLYMRIAPELYLKRLIVGGYEKVFEIGKNFRNEGISTRHNPEFTMVEFYWAHATVLNLMSFVKGLFQFLISWKIDYQGIEIDFSQWQEVKYEDLLRNVGVEDPWSVESLQAFLRHKLEDFNEAKISNNVSELQKLIFDAFVEATLIHPTFVTHYPTALSPLARKNDEDPRVTDRFELFIAGFEVANGFTELNDPHEQAARFEEQVMKKNAGDQEAMYFDHDYIHALTYGMPPTAGCGIGLDRLVMILTNAASIRDIILFPTKKSKEI